MAYGRHVAAVLAAAMAGCLTAAVPAVGAVALDGVSSITADDTVPSKTKVSFYVGLDRPEKAALRRLRKVSDPTSSSYRQFPSRKKVASKYGASANTIKAARASVQRYGLRLHVDDTGVFARVSGTAKQMTDWLGRPVFVGEEQLESGVAVITYTEADFPKGRSDGIREFFGFDVASEFSTAAASLASKNPAYSGRQSGTPRGSCLETVPELSAYTYSVNELRTAYGVEELPAGPKVAKAARVVVLAEGDGFSDRALAEFARCFRLPEVSFDRVAVPGLTGRLPEGDEGDLDVQVIHSVLPGGSKVSVVQTSEVDIRDFLIWSTAFSLKRLPDVITTSYGSCEPQQRKAGGPQAITMTESVLARLSLAGVSMFSAAGDRGSSDCVNNETGKGNPRVAVDYPGSSHHVTSVGGTRIELTAGNRRADEVVWFGPRAQPPLASATGGGGGTSMLFERPWWQRRSVTKSTMRSVPDVAAHAAQTPGWPVVTTAEVGELDLVPVGGTSAATPFTAAAIGLIAASERVHGRPALGQVQPLFYHLAARKPSTFFDVVTGNNDVFDQGCCGAREGYDKASGLGAVRFDKLARRIPRP